MPPDLTTLLNKEDSTMHRTPEQTQKEHGARVEARQRQNDPRPSIFHDLMPDYAQYVREVSSLPELRGKAPSYNDWDKARKLRRVDAVEQIFALLALDALIHDITRTPPEAQERIQPGIDSAEPPFLAFWQDLNAKLEAAGRPEAGYKEARTAFGGGATPLGAMTFIGKEWDGLRAVPAKPVTYLGGTRPSYHGEHREITGKGTVWHKVTNGADLPILYTCPEAALVAAKAAKEEAVAKAFH